MIQHDKEGDKVRVTHFFVTMRKANLPPYPITFSANLVIYLLRDYFSLTHEDLPSSTPSPPQA